mmetsp:Transcript_10895/g.27494  ORF Transcript_10895/g.27494 Transcript_10895/m.27494 type:complete len:250 (-) Transcript_10895:219-968(-)
MVDRSVRCEPVCRREGSRKEIVSLASPPIFLRADIKIAHPEPQPHIHEPQEEFEQLHNGRVDRETLVDQIELPHQLVELPQVPQADELEETGEGDVLVQRPTPLKVLQLHAAPRASRHDQPERQGREDVEQEPACAQVVRRDEAGQADVDPVLHEGGAHAEQNVGDEGEVQHHGDDRPEQAAASRELELRREGTHQRRHHHREAERDCHEHVPRRLARGARHDIEREPALVLVDHAERERAAAVGPKMR